VDAALLCKPDARSRAHAGGVTIAYEHARIAIAARRAITDIARGVTSFDTASCPVQRIDPMDPHLTEHRWSFVISSDLKGSSV
jgi:hypothetical protein